MEHVFVSAAGMAFTVPLKAAQKAALAMEAARPISEANGAVIAMKAGKGQIAPSGLKLDVTMAMMMIKVCMHISTWTHYNIIITKDFCKLS